jgi:hypothetical protein
MTTEEVMRMESTGNKNKWWHKVTGLLVAGMVTGAVVGFAVGKFIMHGHSGAQANGADVTALLLTAFYIVVTAVLLWIASDRMRLARVLEGNAADTPASDDEVRSFLYQAVVMALAGVLLALPVFGARIFAVHPQGGKVYYLGVVLLFAVQTFYNFRLWKISDEFVRNTMAATAGLSFAIGQGGLFLWAAAEHLSLVKPVSSWDLTINMMLLYLIVGSAVSVRTIRRE